MFALGRGLFVGGAVALLFAPSLDAGEISFVSWSSGVASVAAESVVTPLPNNDNVADPDPNPNLLTIIQKDYFAVGPVDIELTVVPSGGTTEYVVKEEVQNSSPIDWDGYHIELGFGTGDSFVKSTPGDGLDFDTPDEDSLIDFAPGPVFFTTVTRPSEDDLVASGDIHDAGEYSGLSYFFHIDVPDGITNFTIRQSPLPVPEPSTFALLGLGAVGLIAMRQIRKA